MSANGLFGIPMLILFGLFLAPLVIVTELGFRIGQRLERASRDPAKLEIGSFQASVLGLLALFLGFTYSAAMSRYEARRELVVKEANAIGTVFLRTSLLPDPARAEIQSDLRRYAELRVLGARESGDIDRETALLTKRIWDEALQGAAKDRSPAMALLIGSINTLIDNYSERQAALANRIPRQVFTMLGLLTLVAMALIGYSCGIAGYRALGATTIIAVLVSAVVILTLDLHEPRQGLILENQQPLIDVRVLMDR
ncbi:hypothetical protein [Microvirga terricola]|uniref:DUF4239 domain-containing protein n=1 Tax=Microvirga terricola TaxID=2719797 RepID=A0ABX0VCW9_9HYPH|nr:hypothetical protein [Microvirga terricola]NIX77518.1 hypothetical protein [Microvirga terricola]